MSENALTIAEAANHFAEIVDRAARLHEATVITHGGKAIARLVLVEPLKTTEDFLKAWQNARHLTPEEAADFESDVQNARGKLPPPT